MAYYLDTSAAVKLVVAEPDTAALSAWLAEHDGEVVSSDLLRTELLRATRRGAPHAMPRARAVLDSLTLMTVPAATFERAADLDPDLLRSLDAVHLAAALELGDDLDGLVTYDDRLADAARLHGITVIAPTVGTGRGRVRPGR
jgi:predicted nucleic acid-binding protein